MGFWSNICGCLEKGPKVDRRTGPSTVDEAESGGEAWKIFFDLQILQVATNFFSEMNQLGHGGFGPVYKVLSLIIGTTKYPCECNWPCRLVRQLKNHLHLFLFDFAVPFGLSLCSAELFYNIIFEVRWNHVMVFFS